MNYGEILHKCYKTYNMFENILNSYVSDYYLENHWSKLPPSWQEAFKDINMEQLSKLLDFNNKHLKQLYPLSLLSLRCLIQNNVVPRNQISNSKEHHTSKDTDSFTKMFWKHVKLKKRHEISILAEICFKNALKTDCYFIVDIGAGLGHLSRMLCYKHGFRVCTFEADPVLSNSAKEMDEIFERELRKKNIELKIRPVHINKKITTDLTAADFILLVKSAFNEHKDNLKFGIVGLHPCGDLGSTLLRLYSTCPQIKFINMASCCYMKLSLTSPLAGFPLSNLSKNNEYKLSYLALEIACHAIENYLTKLKVSEENKKLKIHSYRAVLEKILVTANPELKHSIVNSVKYSDSLTFKKYCEINLSKYDILLDDNELCRYEELIENSWRKVVTFYSIRLFLAPVIETIILYDRLLFLQQCDSCVDVVPAFDCNVSPRNQVIVARKINK